MTNSICISISIFTHHNQTQVSVITAPALQICKLNDPERDQCIKESIQRLLPSLTQNSASFGLPILDPFTYDSVNFDFTNTNFLLGNFALRKVKTFGLTRGKVGNVKSDFVDDQMAIQADLFFPKLLATGQYRANITAFTTLAFASKGQFNITLREVNAKWNIKGKLEDRDGEDYMQIYQFDIAPTASDMKISVSGLFRDENLNKAANALFNQYWRIFYQEMINETRKQWQPLLLEIINNFFATIPFRRLLLQD